LKWAKNEYLKHGRVWNVKKKYSSYSLNMKSISNIWFGKFAGSEEKIFWMEMKTNEQF